MITALVQFKLPQPITREKAREVFSGTAPKYREIEGLIRKYYLLSKDGGTAGGVYLWKSQEDAERLYRAYLHCMARDPGLKIHMYGKDVRPGRKLGHVTVVGDDLDDLLGRAHHAADYLTGVIDE